LFVVVVVVNITAMTALTLQASFHFEVTSD